MGKRHHRGALRLGRAELRPLQLRVVVAGDEARPCDLLRSGRLARHYQSSRLPRGNGVGDVGVAASPAASVDAVRGVGVDARHCPALGHAEHAASAHRDGPRRHWRSVGVDPGSGRRRKCVSSASPRLCHGSVLRRDRCRHRVRHGGHDGGSQRRRQPCSVAIHLARRSGGRGNHHRSRLSPAPSGPDCSRFAPAALRPAPGSYVVGANRGIHVFRVGLRAVRHLCRCGVGAGCRVCHRASVKGLRADGRG